MTIEVLITGRLVGGHPMIQSPVMDDRTNPPTAKMQRDGVTPRVESFVAVAIPKGAETHWNQTEWGAQIHQAAVTGWPGGEYNALTFAWKITDGDSVVPNKKGRKPCEREGYPGHWIVGCSTGLSIKCYHVGKYDPTQQIQESNAVKTGDYCRVVLMVKANNPSESPGVYLNPSLFELSRAGVHIETGTGPDAATAFGGGAATQATPSTPAATTSPTTPAAEPSAPAIAPAADFLNGPAAEPSAPAEASYIDSNGQTWTESQLRGFGWDDTKIATLKKV